MPKRTRTIPLALLAASLVAAAPAAASEVRLEGSTAVFRAAAGEANHQTLAPDLFAAGRVQFSDVYPVDVGPGLDCETSTAGGWHYASCALPGVTAIRIESGDGADAVRVSPDIPFGGAISADGGPGNDDMEGSFGGPAVTFFGGDGDDKLGGSTSDDVLHGGSGNDTLDGYNGNDQVYGDDGDDNLSGGMVFSSDLIDGGAGTDTIDSDWYDAGQPTNSVTVTLDGVADDGRPGEGDNVVNVETIKTRQAARLVAGGYAVTFDVTGTQAGSTTLIGSPGADRLRSYDYDDTIQAGAGDDSIEGGNGHDTIDPGPGRDSVIADAGPGSCNFLECRGVYGNDVIHARDGEVDTIDCGPGNDRVVADKGDVLTNCETVEVDGGTPPGGQPGKPKSKPKAKTCKVPKVKRGTTVKSATKKLKKAKCRVAKKTVKVRSATRRGRVVKLSVKSGKRTSKAVKIHVSRGRR
jgi:hypothetical protein